MKYQKILDTVIDFADKGLFDDVFWYIKDFNNYELLICIQEYTEALNPPHEELGNNYNTVIAKIDSQGLTDHFKNKHTLVASKSFIPNSDSTISDFKYEKDEYVLNQINNINSMKTDRVYGRKIDEAVVLFIMRHPLFSENSKSKALHSKSDNYFVETLQPLLAEWDEETVQHTELKNLYLMSSIKIDDTNHYNYFWGIDVWEYDNNVTIIPNADEEEFLSNMKKSLEQDSELVSRVQFLSDVEIRNLIETEQLFIQEGKVSAEIVTNYHKIIEACGFKYWELLSDDVLSFYDTMKAEDNKKYIKLTKNGVAQRLVQMRERYRPLSIQAIREINLIILKMMQENPNKILPPRLVQLIKTEDKNFQYISSLSNVRNVIIHTFSESDKDILYIAASAYRFVIIKLSEMIDSLS